MEQKSTLKAGQLLLQQTSKSRHLDPKDALHSHQIFAVKSFKDNRIK
jgi:hypothetical protein